MGGEGGKSVPLMQSTDVAFFTSSYIRPFLGLDLFLSSGIHDLPRNSAVVGTICL